MSLEEWTSSFDGEDFPFVESESADITGPGHQDKAAFAEAVNRYDTIMGGVDDVGWTSDDVTHRWGLVSEDGESVTKCAADAPGAVAMTTMWGMR